MDPATAGGLAIGVVSLAFDVFDNSVRFFKFLAFMVEMPKECEQCRLRLLIEYNRLLAWGKAVGMINIPEVENLAVNLGTDPLELCAILSRIGWLLGEFRDLNTRWKNELNPYQQTGQDTPEAADISFLQGVSSLEVAYEKITEERKRRRGPMHIIKWMSKKIGDAKEVVTHPYRVRWVMVDRDAFEAVLKDIHLLTERLHQLLGDYRQNRVNDITAETYRELVLARNDLVGLKDMLGAVTTLIETFNGSSKEIPSSRNENDETLRDLLRLKEINRSTDDILTRFESDGDVDIEKDLKGLISVEKYDGASLSDSFTYAEVDGIRDPSVIGRARGTLSKGDAGIECEAKRLYVPNCIGYIDDVDNCSRHGWIFAMPEGSKRTTTLRSLHSILGEAQYKPTLAQRITLAWKLASSLLYLHTADWLHKGVHSDNVIFLFDGDLYDADKPILSGFDYSRPQSSKTTTRSLQPKWDIYRWPSIQNEAPKAKTSRKTYDIYSLGLVLLEIAHWKPLHRIMRLKRWPTPSAQDSRIRAWLLEEEDYPPFDGNPLLELRDIAGDRYWKAVTRCIVAHGEKGLHVDEKANQAWCTDVGIVLQGAFNEFVVKALQEISM
ncbi:hypothetical protein PISL3812_09757 [Talaromyces islandicus]|uniref:Uncharacterized protein n=1 Tax=Talaromyces islandicus TaxID=28573 RepID=A0A0U1MBJ3_TALIS|nr:hypothetical protein PISL3812_09757 [Talaromyces islandicus]